MAVLVLAEKPSVSQAIAAALGVKGKKDGYIEGNGYIISWCVGHLVELANADNYEARYSRWAREDLPILPDPWKFTVSPGTKKQFGIIKSLMGRADVTELVEATDAGREGELIFRLVYREAGCRKPFSRLWISSMEDSAIRKGFENLAPGETYDALYDAALCRAKADWLVGINATRLFTTLYQGKTLNVGRVMTPTLALLTDREQAITGFQKEKFYTVDLDCGTFRISSGRFASRTDAEKLRKLCVGKSATVKSAERQEKTEKPPKLYDLTTLQREANRIYGYTAQQTLDYIQLLYEKKLATYPRTDSRYLTDDMGAAARQAAEAAELAFADIFAGSSTDDALDVSALLDSGRVSDHHALIPTREAGSADLSGLPDDERKILALVSCRLLCAAGEKHLYRTSRAGLSCGGQAFTVSGRLVVKNGWKNFEDAFRRFCKDTGDKGAGNKNTGSMEENAVPPELAKGQELDVVQVEVKEHYTQPPKRFTDGSLLAAMERAGSARMSDSAERRGLGTPATRADIIEKLAADGFIKREKKQIIPTKEGMELAAVLPDSVKSPELTAEWENSLALVAAGEMDADAFMDGIEKMVSGLVRDYGSASVDAAAKELFAPERTVLGACPKCGGQIVKGKYGAYCAGKCGMSVAKYYSTPFTDSQVKSLLDGKKILLKGLKGRDGKPYDLCLEPDGIEDYSYEKDGKTVSGSRFSFKKSYPGRK